MYEVVATDGVIVHSIIGSIWTNEFIYYCVNYNTTFPVPVVIDAEAVPLLATIGIVLKKRGSRYYCAIFL